MRLKSASNDTMNRTYIHPPNYLIQYGRRLAINTISINSNNSTSV